MPDVNKLRQIPLLAELEQDELTQLVEVIKERKAPKGSYIVYVDDESRNIMFIAQGEVKVSLVSDDGKEIVLAKLGQGDFFGEIALLTGEDRSANVIATEDCVLYVLQDDDFYRHVIKTGGLSLAMMRELAQRLASASSKIGDLALFDVYRRVARTLKSLAKEEERPDGNYLVIEKRPTHQELAAMVGTSREMVTRALKGLEEDNCIAIDGKRIEVYKLPL